MLFSRICLFLIGVILGCQFWIQVFRLTTDLFQKQVRNMKFISSPYYTYIPVSHGKLQSTIVPEKSTPEPLPQSAHSYRLSDYPSPDPENDCLSYPFLFHSLIWRKQFQDVQECHSRNHHSKPSSVAEVEKSYNEYGSLQIFDLLDPNTPSRIIPFETAYRGSTEVTCV